MNQQTSDFDEKFTASDFWNSLTGSRREFFFLISYEHFDLLQD